MKKVFRILVLLIISVPLHVANLANAEGTPLFTYDFATTTNTEGAKWKFTLKPGETIEDAFIVHNLDTERTIELTPQAGQKGDFPADPLWFNLPDKITLLPQEAKTVPFSVTVPQDVEPNNYTGTLKVILTNYYGISGGGMQVFVALGKVVNFEILSPDPDPLPVPSVTLTGKSYKQASNNKIGSFLDWEDLTQLGTDFDKYNIKYKRGYYENFTSEKTANSYISYGSYYNLVGLEPGYMWTFQVVPVKKVDGLYVEVAEKSNMIHCKTSDKLVSDAFVCSYLSPSEAAAVGITP